MIAKNNSDIVNSNLYPFIIKKNNMSRGMSNAFN